MSNEINTILNSYHSATLWEMAHAANLDVTDRRGKKLRKTDLNAKMRAEFFAEARVRASWELLDERERAVINRLLLRGGTVSTQRFRREILRAGLATHSPRPDSHYYSSVPYAEGYSGHPNRRHSRVFEDIIARLTYRGLVFSRKPGYTTGGTPYKLQFHPGAILYIPDVIRRCLPAAEPELGEVTAWQPTRVETGQPGLLLRDLYLYWDFVRRNEVALITAGFVGKRSLKAINQVLLVPDPSLESARREDGTGRLYLLRHLLESLQLLRTERGYLHPAGKDPLQIPSFWSWAPIEQLSACLAAWLTSGGQERLGDNAAKYGPRYTHAQGIVIDVLRTLPSKSWFEVEELLERVQERDVDFLFPEHSRVETYRGNWYYGYTGGYYYGHPKDLLTAFERFEAEFVSRCLSGFLHQLGAVELGYGPSEDDSWAAFRLTPDGQRILGTTSAEGRSQSDQDETGKLIMQPNFQLIAMGPVSLSMLAQMDLICDRESADRGAFQYRLSRESVYRAQQMGMQVADVLGFLEQTSDVELPQNVRRSLEEWAAQHEQIVFRSGVSLLQAADADLLNRLMDEQGTGKHLVRPVTSEVAFIKKKHEKRVISALVGQGLFPAVSGVNPEATDSSVIIRDDGTLHPIHAVPGLHLQGRLSRFAEAVTETEWRLTPTSVRRAGGSKNKVLRLLDELRALHRGPFPEELINQVKAWGGYYGQASAETLTLIEFGDQATLNELMSHPELASSLIPFPAGDRALAVVPEAKLAQVKEILAGFGVRIREGLRR
jgi:hypothetical protein